MGTLVNKSYPENYPPNGTTVAKATQRIVYENNILVKTQLGNIEAMTLDAATEKGITPIQLYVISREIGSRIVLDITLTGYAPGVTYQTRSIATLLVIVMVLAVAVLVFFKLQEFTVSATEFVWGPTGTELPLIPIALVLVGGAFFLTALSRLAGGGGGGRYSIPVQVK